MNAALLHLAVTLAGALLGAAGACVPGLHAYNLLALASLAWTLAPDALPPPLLAPLALSVTAAYAVTSAIPAILLAAPDESALFTVLPGQRYLMAGRGYEAVLLTGFGSLAAALMVLLAGPLIPRLIPPLHVVLRPHMHWIVWSVILFMLLSEWPKGWRSGPGGPALLFDGWKTSLAGCATFGLSGLLGFILFYKPPVAAGAAFQNLMPAFLGLFTLPWLLLNLVSRVRPPEQVRAVSTSTPLRPLLLGSFAGVLGGGFAAFCPALTGGVGSLLAGHATSLRDERAFLVSQGAARLAYYAGGFLLLFVPGLHLSRGGGAAMLRAHHLPVDGRDYAWALAAVAISTALAFALLGFLARAFLGLVRCVGYGRLSAAALALMVALTAAVTGLAGLAVLVVAAAIGLMPVLMGARRMNALGVILLPLACQLSGVGDAVARVLGVL